MWQYIYHLIDDELAPLPPPQVHPLVALFGKHGNVALHRRHLLRHLRLHFCLLHEQVHVVWHPSLTRSSSWW